MNMFLIEEMFLKVEELFNESKFPEGKKLLEEILEIEPGYGRAHNHIGWLYYSKFDDFAKAEYHYKLAIKFAVDYHPSYVNYMYLLNFTNRHQDLRNLAVQALEVRGVAQYTVYSQLARSYEITLEYKKAIENYKEAIRYALNKEDMDLMQQGLDRIKSKQGILQKKFSLF